MSGLPQAASLTAHDRGLRVRLAAPVRMSQVRIDDRGILSQATIGSILDGLCEE